MDTGNYTFDALSKKYDKFSAPFFEISVGGTKLSEGGMIVTTLEVEISADGTAGGCSFVVDGQYNHEHSKWENKALDIVKVGAELTVRGGYVKDKELFYGYVDDYTIDFQEEGPPRLTVSGLDGLGYLMSFQEPLYGGKKKAGEIVKTILQKSVSAGFAKKVTMGTLTDFEAPILKEDIDDWKFLNLMAQRFGVSLFAIDGELIFDNVASKTSPIMTLSFDKGLFSFQKRVSLAHQVGKVVIKGRDVNQKAIKGEANSVSISGSGKTASQLVSALKDATLEEFSEYVRTQQECKTVAQSRLDGIAMGLVSGGGTCVGIPELIPGRYVEIAGMDNKSNGTYFVSKVRHLFEMNGYQTAFEIKGAKA